MEEELSVYLKREGIKTSTIDLLALEEICSFKTFISLKEEHFLRFLKRKEISVGQHALLWESWRKYTGMYLIKYICRQNVICYF